MHLTGIINAHHFRNRIIETREARRQQYNGQRTGSVLAGNGESKPAEHLAELGRSADRLDEIAGMLRDKRFDDKAHVTPEPTASGCNVGWLDSRK